MQKILISILALGVPFLSACSDWSLPEVPDVSLPDSIPDVIHKVEIQQGNIIDQRMINKLRPGMGKRQVRFILGSPMINDTFHADRWDYIYRKHISSHAPTKATRVSLFFNKDALVRIEGDMRPEADDTLKKKTEVVDVPYQERNAGIFDRLLGTVGLESEDAPVKSRESSGGGGHAH